METRRTAQQMKLQLINQLIFLENSARLFDEGCKREAVRLAAQLGISFHDSMNSTGLLSRLGLGEFAIKSAIAGEPTDSDRIFHGYGVAMELRSGYRLLEPVLSLDFFEELPATEWWTQVIWRLKGGAQITRRDLVRDAADKDGGAHVGPNITDRYAGLAAPEAAGEYWRPIAKGDVRCYAEGAHLVALSRDRSRGFVLELGEHKGIGPGVSWYQGPLAKRQRSAQLSLRKSLRRNSKSKRLA
jgi:hypothetical protein